MSESVGEFFPEGDAGRSSGAGRGRSTGGSNVGGSANQLAMWSNVAAPRPQHEDRMQAEDAGACWNRVYALFGSSGEEMRKEVRLAVYAYFAVNGCSRYGEYERQIRLGSGSAVSAKDVVKEIGSTKLRQFLRSDVTEAYYALKGSHVLEHDPVAAAKAHELGCPDGMAYLMADYLRYCPEFSAAELEIYDRLFERGIKRAGANRGGKTVEESARDRDARMVGAQREASARQAADEF